MREYDDTDIKRKDIAKDIAFVMMMCYILFVGCFLIGFAIYFKPCEVHAETDAPQVYHNYDGK